MPDHVSFTVDGLAVSLATEPITLLEALRDRLGVRAPKDGCSPQGQCGCCTVLVDGQARVACVTPLARVAGRAVTTFEGLADGARWAEAFCATGASQCGFCTPGIVVRLASRAPGADVKGALAAHLCRCTGWQTILEAAERIEHGAVASGGRDLAAAARRATIEGGAAQAVGAPVAAGRAGFADDGAPLDALVAMLAADGTWVVGESIAEARQLAGAVQGRRSTLPLRWPLEVPDPAAAGVPAWDRVLQTTWVEPAYLEPDASWCAPGGEPASPLANGGAFGAKAGSPVATVARELADRWGRPVRVLYRREDVVRYGPKRPPMAIGALADGRGAALVAATPGIDAAIAAVAPRWTVTTQAVPGPPTSSALRGAGWVEAAVVAASLRDRDVIIAPNGAVAEAVMSGDRLAVRVRCGEALDAVVLRSYCIGAAHQALGWVRSEGLAVDEHGEVHDLTMRSFGILKATQMPPVDVEIDADDTAPVNGSDAVFAAVAAAVWRSEGHPARWPTARQ